MLIQIILLKLHQLHPHQLRWLLNRLPIEWKMYHVYVNKQEINIPIHLHTHDTSSIQSATYLKAIEAGVDVVDVALGGLSGLTSQPNFNSVVEMLKFQDRENPLDINSLNEYSNYWETVREYYYPFESGLKAGSG